MPIWADQLVRTRQACYTASLTVCNPYGEGERTTGKRSPKGLLRGITVSMQVRGGGGGGWRTRGTWVCSVVALLKKQEDFQKNKKITDIIEGERNLLSFNCYWVLQGTDISLSIRVWNHHKPLTFELPMFFPERKCLIFFSLMCVSSKPFGWLWTWVGSCYSPQRYRCAVFIFHC